MNDDSQLSTRRQLVSIIEATFQSLFIPAKFSGGIGKIYLEWVFVPDLQCSNLLLIYFWWCEAALRSWRLKARHKKYSGKIRDFRLSSGGLISHSNHATTYWPYRTISPAPRRVLGCLSLSDCCCGRRRTSLDDCRPAHAGAAGCSHATSLLWSHSTSDYINHHQPYLWRQLYVMADTLCNNHYHQPINIIIQSLNEQNVCSRRLVEGGTHSRHRPNDVGSAVRVRARYC